MNPQELARWLAEEHQKVSELAANMQEIVAVAPRTNQHKWIEGLREAFERLRAHLMKHISLEERDGYMVPVTKRRPALGREVDRLAHEHREFKRILDHIHDQVESLEPEDDLTIRDCCRRIQDLLSYVEHHENAENLLVLTALTDDIGTSE